MGVAPGLVLVVEQLVGGLIMGLVAVAEEEWIPHGGFTQGAQPKLVGLRKPAVTQVGDLAQNNRLGGRHGPSHERHAQEGHLAGHLRRDRLRLRHAEASQESRARCGGSVRRGRWEGRRPGGPGGRAGSDKGRARTGGADSGQV